MSENKQESCEMNMYSMKYGRSTETMYATYLAKE